MDNHLKAGENKSKTFLNLQRQKSTSHSKLNTYLKVAWTATPDWGLPQNVPEVHCAHRHCPLQGLEASTCSQPNEGVQNSETLTTNPFTFKLNEIHNFIYKCLTSQVRSWILSVCDHNHVILYTALRLFNFISK